MKQQSYRDDYQLSRRVTVAIGIGAGVVVVLVLFFVMFGLAWGSTPPPPRSTSSSATPSVTVTPTPTPSVTPIPSSRPSRPVQQAILGIPPQAVPTRLVIASADIDVPLQHLPMTPAQIDQRVYDAPQHPDGYWVQFTEAGQTYFDLPGAGMDHAAFIVGHSCGYTRCIDANGRWWSQAEWPFTRLANPTLVKAGTGVSVFTTSGEVCSTVVRIERVGRDDAAAQDVILNQADENHYLVINTCETDDNSEGYLVLAKIRTCQG